MATNFITNPRVANATTGWIAGTSVTVTRETSLPTATGLPAGVTTALRLQSTTALAASTNVAALIPTEVPAAGAYWGGAYVYIPAAWSGGSIIAQTASFSGATGTILGTADDGTRDAWQEVRFGPVSLAAGDLAGSVRVGAVSSWPSGQHFYATAFLFSEQDADYFDGDSPNAEWTGTPHASTSVLTIPDASSRTLHPVLKIGAPHIGPLRVGERN